MDAPLLLAGLAMGVAATPHCAAMCGAPCAALTTGCGRSAGGFHLGRIAGYMAGGAVAASSVGLLQSWSQALPVLRPLWTVLHLALLALGLWWLATGRQADWMMRRSSLPVVRMPGRAGRKPLRATLAGLGWVAWPCGALQAALLLSALASTAAGGALVMGAFAIGSLPALAALPALLSANPSSAWGGALRRHLARHGYRLAGAGLVLGSGWALTHGLWRQVAAWCLS